MGRKRGINLTALALMSPTFQKGIMRTVTGTTRPKTKGKDRRGTVKKDFGQGVVREYPAKGVNTRVGPGYVGREWGAEPIVTGLTLIPVNPERSVHAIVVRVPSPSPGFKATCHVRTLLGDVRVLTWDEVKRLYTPGLGVENPEEALREQLKKLVSAIGYND